MYVMIELDKERQLRYDFNAIADVEERAGLGIVAMFNEDRVGFHSIRLLLWGGLKWKDRGLTVDRAGTMINTYLQNGGTIEVLMEKIREALQKSGIISYQEVDEEEGNVTAETVN